MAAIKIIPCLDVKDGRVVKGINFVDLIDVGDPAENAKIYNQQGADELTFLDITATNEKRKTIIEVVEKVVGEINIPLTVGGGIRNIDDFGDILKAGASKVGINTAAVIDPSIISKAAEKYGSKCVVSAIDARVDPNMPNGYGVYINGGKKAAGIDALVWAKKVESLGAGELLVTSMDADGTKNGFDIPLTKIISTNVGIPVTASGGGGTLEHFYEAVSEGKASAVLAASVFHFRELSIGGIKQYLQSRGIEVII